jgi:hypothetical protein
MGMGMGEKGKRPQGKKNQRLGRYGRATAYFDASDVSCWVQTTVCIYRYGAVLWYIVSLWSGGGDTYIVRVSAPD